MGRKPGRLTDGLLLVEFDIKYVLVNGKLKLLVNLDSLFLFLFLKREKLNELISNWRKKNAPVCAKFRRTNSIYN